ncbi:MAG: hypothetical protein KU38_09195 [Sulfurovum sp. FS08-3]|nr:MAG: hypothetical protein KU38_09195 [Sulfurovum sp. FS08-3]
MITLTIDDSIIENIYIYEFEHNPDKFFHFIKSSFAKWRESNTNQTQEENLQHLQSTSLAHLWDNNEDKVWDEL